MTSPALPIPAAEAPRVEAILDTSLPPEQGCTSIAAALREARLLVGRDPDTGLEPPGNQHRGTWSGALIHLVFLEQIGSCFSPIGAQLPKEPGIAEAARWFGGCAGESPRILEKLRHRFAHDFTLERAERGQPRFVLDDEPGAPLFKKTRGRPWVGLVALADLATTVAVAVGESARRGDLAVHHTGGLNRVEERFRMIVGPPHRVVQPRVLRTRHDA